MGLRSRVLHATPLESAADLLCAARAAALRVDVLVQPLFANSDAVYRPPAILGMLLLQPTVSKLCRQQSGGRVTAVRAQHPAR